LHTVKISAVSARLFFHHPHVLIEAIRVLPTNCRLRDVGVL